MIMTVRSVAGRIASAIKDIVSAASGDRSSLLGANKFVELAPDHQNAIEIFQGRWATDLSRLNPAWSGGVAELVNDSRPRMAAEYLGSVSRIDGMSVLELGPLEGMHTHQLEQLGAGRILAIEANVEAYLKCLVIKEALGMKAAHFMLGDFNLFLASSPERFDMVFCVGVLYHMEDPLTLIRNIGRTTSKCFVWTHYHDPNRLSDRKPEQVVVDGFPATYFRNQYRDRALPQFWGGNKASSSWMLQADIVSAFRHFGFDTVEIIVDEPYSQNGASFCFAASRTTGPSSKLAPISV